MTKNTQTKMLPNTEKLPCKVRHEVGGHYASQRTYFTVEKSDGTRVRFAPRYEAIEEWDEQKENYGRSVYSFTHCGVRYYIWADKGRSHVCSPFRNEEVSPTHHLLFPE